MSVKVFIVRSRAFIISLTSIMNDSTSSIEQMAQQNRLNFAKQKLKCKGMLSEVEYSRTEVPDLVSKYEGYMQIYRRKQGEQPPT